MQFITTMRKTNQTVIFLLAFCTLVVITVVFFVYGVPAIIGTPPVFIEANGQVYGYEFDTYVTKRDTCLRAYLDMNYYSSSNNGTCRANSDISKCGRNRENFVMNLLNSTYPIGPRLLNIYFNADYPTFCTFDADTIIENDKADSRGVAAIISIFFSMAMFGLYFMLIATCIKKIKEWRKERDTTEDYQLSTV